MTPQEIEKLPYRKNVGIMLASEGGKVWAGQRLDAMRLGTGETAWQMPQGGIDKGEKPRAAALRELEEEIGVTPDLVTVEAKLGEVGRQVLRPYLASAREEEGALEDVGQLAHVAGPVIERER